MLALGLRSYDVVILTFSIMAWYLYFPSVLHRLKVIYFARHYGPFLLDDTKIKSGILLFIYRNMARLSYKFPFFLVVNSGWTGEMISKSLKGGKRYVVVNNGVDLSTYKPDDSASIKNGSRKKVLVVGKRQKWKGLDDLITALCMLSRSYKDFELLIMSTDELDIRESLPFEVRIIHPKNDVSIVEVYHQADVFVSPSWYEGFANPPLEAMACGAPVVLTDSGGVREYAVHDYNCLMSPPQQPEKLAENIKLVLRDREVALRLTQNGLETVKAFTWGKSVDELERVLMQEVAKE
jgi:glycosyltransferase involved in cell wall biosynthesis